jgi:serine/threonine protein kinase
MNELSNDNVVEICGTPRYTAPELFQGKTPGTASDVYSFGCVLYTICSLEVPFQESNSSTKTNLQDFQTKIVAGERPALDHIPSHDVRKLISECWAHNPADRPSFQDIAHDRLPAITRPDTHSLKPSMNPPDSLTWNTSFTSSFRSESGLISDVSGLATPTHCKPSPNEKNLLAHEPLFRGSNFEARISIAKQRCKIM